MIEVAVFAARADGTPAAAITSTLRLASSATNSGSPS
jgi:hypothetical protein